MSFINLYIDIDNDYDQFLESRTFIYIKENWKYVTGILGYNPDISYRRSSSGHVHLKVILRNDVSIIDQFKIRSLLHDDPWRIGIDLRRLAIQGATEINRIFDTKVKNGTVYTVGEWQDISIEVI